MDFKITDAAKDYISDTCSEMVSNSDTEQPVLTIYFKGTTVAI